MSIICLKLATLSDSFSRTGPTSNQLLSELYSTYTDYTWQGTVHQMKPTHSMEILEGKLIKTHLPPSSLHVASLLGLANPCQASLQGRQYLQMPK